MARKSNERKAGKRAHRARFSIRELIHTRRDWWKALLAVGVLLAILIRYPLLPSESGDMAFVWKKWYDFIAQNGHFAALKYEFADHNVPYLYLLATASVLSLGIPTIVAIKTISIIFDFVLAFFVYRCVRLKYREPTEEALPILAALVALLMPTVVLNSAMWGQAEAIYTAFMVACLYYLLAGRQAAAFIAFGVAFSFKAQSVFLCPLFLWLLGKKKVDWRYFGLSPAVYVAGILPAWFIGRPLCDLLMIYPNQTDKYAGTRLLSLNAPNLYRWVPKAYYDFYPVGIAFTAVIVLGIAYFVSKSRVEITADRLVFMATFSVLIMPYLLPKMHDRFFFPADVIAIILAFYCPRYWYVPAVIGSVSFFAYMPFLLNRAYILQPWLPVALLLLIAVLGRQFLLMFSNKYPLRGQVQGPGPTTDGGRTKNG